ncbi:MAG: cation transporter [Mariprofundaceae bacterium]
MRKILFITAFFSMTVIYAQIGTAQEQSITMHVSGMTCGTCPISVRHRAMQMEGIHSAIVDIDTALATVTYEDSKQSLRPLLRP